ncbi:MAG: peptidylprolyl isomerase, partial [Thermoplasmata archaeon]
DLMANEVRASHILVDKKTDADKLMEKLKSGSNFEDLARKHSSCPSGKKGGDLGYFTRNRMVKEFETAAFAAKKGDIVGPVKTQFGWHIIKVTDTRG